MRVLFISPVGVIGGAERCLLDILWSLRSRTSVTATLMTLGEGPLLDEARRLGVRAECLPLPPALASFGESRPSLFASARAVLGGSLVGVRFVADFSRALRSRNVDLIHTHGVKAHLLAEALAPVRRPLVVHLHDYVSERRVSRRALQALRLRRAAAIAVSRSVADDFARTVSGVRVAVVHNAVDIERFAPGSAERGWLDGLGSAPPRASAFTFGLVATYADWKGHDVVIRAAAELERMAPALDFRCYLVGGPIYSTAGSQWSRAALEALAAQSSVVDRVSFVPFQSDVARVYRSLDVVVHASTRREPFGLTIAEAMASGRPVVVTKGGGSEELIEDGVSGLAVPPQDPSALARALAKLASDEALREELGKAARQRVVERFDRSRLGPQVEAVYRAVLTSGVSRRAHERGGL